LRAKQLATLLILFCLVTSSPVLCDDGGGWDWWSNITNWWYQNVQKPVSDAISGAGQWIQENIVQPVSNSLSGAGETVNNAVSSVGEAVSNAISTASETVNSWVTGAGEWFHNNVTQPVLDSMDVLVQGVQNWVSGWSGGDGGEEDGGTVIVGGGGLDVDTLVDNVDKYFEGSVYIGEEAHPTGETGLDLVDDIADIDFPTLWLGWSIDLPWGGVWAVGLDLMGPFESMFNKGAEISFELFFKKPVGLMWSLWSNTYKACRGVGLAAPFAVTAAAGVEIGVGAVLVMIFQKIIDIVA